MKAKLTLGCLVCCTLLATHIAAGESIELPAGEQVLQVEWTADSQLLILASTPSGFALRFGDPETGDVSVITAPRSFSELKPGSQILLSPAGNGVAALVPSQEATEPSRLSLYRIVRNALSEVSLRKLSRDFYPAAMAWRSDGSNLFVSAAPYMGAEEEASIVGISTTTGAISGQAKKSSLDLISELFYVPRRDALAVKCGGIGGEYPAEPVVVLLKPGSAAVTVLHTESSEFSLGALPDGTLMLIAPHSARERWVLLHGQDSLRRSEQRMQISEWTSSADGKWLGGIVDGKAVKRGAGQSYGIVRTRDGKRGILTAKPCKLLRFSPDGKTAAAVSSDGASIAVIPIPPDPTE